MHLPLFHGDTEQSECRLMYMEVFLEKRMYM